jgi:hypothetical protein
MELPTPQQAEDEVGSISLHDAKIILLGELKKYGSTDSSTRLDGRLSNNDKEILRKELEEKGWIVTINEQEFGYSLNSFVYLSKPKPRIENPYSVFILPNKKPWWKFWQKEVKITEVSYIEDP